MALVSKAALLDFFKSFRQRLDNRYAPQASPTFTGTPKAPTPDGNTGTQVATVDYVKSSKTVVFDADGKLTFPDGSKLWLE